MAEYSCIFFFFSGVVESGVGWHLGRMSSQEEDVAPEASGSEVEPQGTGEVFTVIIGATVPTGFEHTAAEEVKEKIGVEARISKDRGRIYFPITTDKLFQVRQATADLNLPH